MTTVATVTTTQAAPTIVSLGGQVPQALCAVQVAVPPDLPLQPQPEAATSPTNTKRESYPDQVRAKVSAARSPNGDAGPYGVALASPLAAMSPAPPAKPRDGPSRPTSKGSALHVASEEVKRESTELEKSSMVALLSVGTVKFDPHTGAPAKTIVIPSLEDVGFQLKVDQVAHPDPKVNLMQRVAARRSVANRKSMASSLLGVGFQAVSLQTCSIEKEFTFKHTDEVMSFAFGPAFSNCLVSAGEDRTLVLWDMDTKARRREVKLCAAAVAVAYSPSGLYVAAGTIDSKVTVWDAETLKETGDASMEGNVLSVALTSDPKELLAVGTTAKKVMLLSLPDMQELADLRHDGYVHSVSFSNQGGFLAGGGGIDDMHGLMTKKGEHNQMKTIIWQVTGESDCCKFLGSILFDDLVHATAWSPSGKLLAVGGENQMVALLLVDRDFEKTSELHCAAGVRCLSWCPGSRFLATAGEDLQVTVWDILIERVVLQLPKSNDWICCVSWSPNLDWLAFSGFGCDEVRLTPIEIVEHDPHDGSECSSAADDEEAATLFLSEREVDGATLKMFSVPDTAAVSKDTEAASSQPQVEHAEADQA